MSDLDVAERVLEKLDSEERDALELLLKSGRLRPATSGPETPDEVEIDAHQASIDDSQPPRTLIERLDALEAALERTAVGIERVQDCAYTHNERLDRIERQNGLLPRPGLLERVRQATRAIMGMPPELTLPTDAFEQPGPAALRAQDLTQERF